MSNGLKVNFYLKRGEVKSDGTAPITGRISVGKSMAQFSAKCSIQVSLWDTQSGRAVGKSKVATDLNRALERINLSIHSHYTELLAKKENITAVEIKNAFQGIASQQETLISSCDKYESMLSLRVGVNITLESYKRYGISFNHLAGNQFH